MSRIDRRLAQRDEHETVPGRRAERDRREAGLVRGRGVHVYRFQDTDRVPRKVGLLASPFLDAFRSELEASPSRVSYGPMPRPPPGPFAVQHAATRVTTGASPDPVAVSRWPETVVTEPAG